MSATDGARIRIGTRSSALALAQTRSLAELLPGAEIVALSTTGDHGAGVGVGAGAADAGGADRTAGADKSRWVDTIEDALLAGEIDLAVHSAKDVPGELAAGLELLGSPARGPVEDVLCVTHGRRVFGSGDGASSAEGKGESESEDESEGEQHDRNGEHGTGHGGDRDGEGGHSVGVLEGLARGARVGTSSIRRAAQLRAARADLDVVRIAGNVDTRLRRLADPGERLDAIVLARAGLRRLGREDAIAGPGALDPARFVPAPGQGALALQARADDARVREVAATIIDPDTTFCLKAERALARALQASCDTPLGAHAAPAGRGCLLLRAWVGLPDGSAWVADELVGGFYDPDALGERVAERMSAAGAADLLREAERMAPAAHHRAGGGRGELRIPPTTGPR